MEPEDMEELEEDDDDDEEEVELEEEPPPIGFWEFMPPPEEDFEAPELLPPEPIGDLALEDGGVPGTWDCCIFIGDNLSAEPPDRE